MVVEMDLESLESIVNNLKAVMEILSSRELEDRVLRSRYAEFLVAKEMASRGYEVQVLGERWEGFKSADIYVPEIDKRVEVKSGAFRMEEGITVTFASFGKGKQIRNGKFDVCVFVAFDGIEPEFYVFTRDELMEVAEKERKELADHPGTNPCLLVLCRSYEDYEEYMTGIRKLDVEIDLHRNPGKYRDRWDKNF